MSAEILRSALLKSVTEQRERYILALRQCKYAPAVGTDKGVVPAVDIAQIALYANQCNAFIESLDWIASRIAAEYTKITQPEPTAEERKPKRKKEMY